MSDYSIWVLEFCYMLEVPKGMVTHGSFNEGFVRMPFCYTVLKGHGQVALIDVGFSYKEHGQDLARTFNMLNWRSPSVVLAECGLTPQDITTVFLTHAHFDHMGAIDDFPNAKFYIQERELAKWVWALTLDRRFRWLLGSTDPRDIVRAVELAREGRLVSIDGDRENMIPGVDLHAAFDTHTWGSMYVKVRSEAARAASEGWIFAGDLIYSFTNLRGIDPKDPQYVPNNLNIGNHTNLLMVTDEMVKRVGGDVMRVIPIHDDGLKTAYPTRITKEGLAITEIALAKGEPSRVQV
jgi:glyoxylase-like metal-dependent hydrolase (beta-lactamase superfamily II)